MNSAFIPVLHKMAIDELIKIADNTSKIKIDRSDKNEVLVIMEGKVWLIDKFDYSISFYQYNPSISIWVPSKNVNQYFNEAGYDIKKLEKFIN